MLRALAFSSVFALLAVAAPGAALQVQVDGPGAPTADCARLVLVETDTTSSRADVYISEVIDVDVTATSLDFAQVQKSVEEALAHILSGLGEPGEIGEGDTTVLVELVIPRSSGDLTGLRFTFEVTPLACAGL